MITICVIMVTCVEAGVALHCKLTYSQPDNNNPHPWAETERVLLLLSPATCHFLQASSFIIITWLIMAPAYLWSPLVAAALKVQNQPPRQHVPRIVRLTALPIICALCTNLWRLLRPDQVTIGVEVLSVVVLTYLVGTLLYILGWRSWLEFFRVVLPCCIYSLDNVQKKLRGHLHDLRPAVTKRTYTRHPSKDGGTQGAAPNEELGLEEAEAWNTGSAFKQKCMAIVLIQGLSLPLYVRAAGSGASIVLFAARYSMVIFSYLMYVGFSEDHPSDWSNLNDEHPGFGLVMNAVDLYNALSSDLAGKEYKGPLRSYKASMLRMEETMAVSYRWQSASRSFAGGRLELNMSSWQINALKQAIQESKCL